MPIVNVIRIEIYSYLLFFYFLADEKKCTCGPMPGYHCGSRVNSTEPVTGEHYLSGKCAASAQYVCEENGEDAKLVRICPGSGNSRCIQGAPGNDHCAGRRFA